jgi:type II secretory pathway predicted ATPase ExeA
VWTRYWKLSADPFAGPATPYVPVAPHEEALARLEGAIASGRRRALLHGGAGLGKSLILARTLTRTRGPTQRVAFLSSPSDGGALFAGLAERLGRRVPAGASRGLAWKALEDAVRLCRWQRRGVVLVIDDCQHLTDRADRLDLERLAHLDPHPDAQMTVLQAYRTALEPDPESEPHAGAAPWELVIRLPALTRSDAETYLTAKLAAVGRSGLTFTPRAITHLHAAATGNPRTLDHLAALALSAAALRGLEIVTPDVVAEVAPTGVPFPWSPEPTRSGRTGWQELGLPGYD